MSRVLCFVYGLLAYLIGVPTLVYAVGFLIDQVVPKGINDGEVVPVSQALMMNVVLLLLLPIQHSIMARPSFKAKWTRIVPEAIERSTFVLVTGLLLWLLYWQWRPMPELVWDIKTSSLRSLLMALYFAGWVLLFGSSFLIDHFDLFGLRQVYFCLQGKEYTPPVFVERLVYKWIRHPLMLGFITAFWAAPTMTQGRLLFASVTTAYIMVGIQMEERDLIANHGDDYKDYRQRTGMLLPISGRKA
jgi:protein-S-isoprenylcysteine O-methyltransferase Ste14